MLNVQGQPRAIAQLQRALASDRLASTWMFAGPQGVGKFTLAVALAKTVLCDKPLHEANGKRVAHLAADFRLTLPCNTCESCRAVDHGSHPDLHIVTKELKRIYDSSGKSKATTVAIEVIRAEIIGDPQNNRESKIAKRSMRGRGKFFIIDQADLIEWQAQNALLKSLEEPPPQTYLILVTTSPGELFSTIRSRSQLVEFPTLPDGIIAKAMQEEGLGKEDSLLMARLTRGSLGRARHWLGDIREIELKNAAAAERAEKKKAKAAEPADDDEESTDKFTPGGILAWTRELSKSLDNLVAGRGAASDVAALMSKFAVEYSGLQLVRDKLASADRLKRDAIGLFMTIAAEWFADRLRHALGTPYSAGGNTATIPAETGGLDHGLVPQLIASAREAEGIIDMNVNEKILLAATTTQWEKILQEAH